MHYGMIITKCLMCQSTMNFDFALLGGSACDDKENMHIIIYCGNANTDHMVI